jgi:hypothetical protein
MTTAKVKAKKRLTNAGKRYITLPSVMIRIPYRGRIIECSTTAEAIEILKHIDAEERPANDLLRQGTMLGAMQEVFGTKSAWSRTSFWKFMDSLGEAQTHILRLLVKKHRISDEELRKALKLDSNQALAGVLSGISKQAGALNIPARAVYTVEDERKGGELTKTYAVAFDFLGMAREMNWTGE